MPDPVPNFLVLLAQLLEICGAVFLLLGFMVDTTRWLFRRIRKKEPLASLQHYRRTLGYSVLIGLELMVAATIVKTITVEPTIEGMGFLAGMVTVRTILGWTTTLEISGHWPWQKGNA